MQEVGIAEACELVFPVSAYGRAEPLAVKRQVALHLAAQPPGAWMNMAGCHLPAVSGYNKRRAGTDPAKPSYVLKADKQHFSYSSGRVALNHDAVYATARQLLAEVGDEPSRQPSNDGSDNAVQVCST